MNEFQTGELVDVALRGARVVENGAKHLHLSVGGNDLYLATVALPSVRITRVAPAEWPPRPGDIWADEDGAEWFARSGSASDVTVYLASARAGFVSEDPEQILALDGPLRLVRRAEDLTQGGREVGASGPANDSTEAPTAAEQVWAASRRQGLTFHTIGGSGAQTLCGRSMFSGETLTTAEATALGGARCTRCHPGGVV